MPHTNNKKILLVGNCVLDQVWEIDRFPQQDEEFRARAHYRQLGGNACNSAQILAQLGHQVQLISSMANDADASWIRQQLDLNHIDTENCPVHQGAKSPLSCIWLSKENGSRTITHYRDLPELEFENLDSIEMADYQWIHFEGRNVQNLLRYLEKSAGQIKTALSLEIEKDRPQILELLPFMDTVIVSNAYLHQKNVGAEYCIQQMRDINVELNVVCTLGDQGLVAENKKGMRVKMEAEPVNQVIDSLGAGDCFIAGLISRLSQQYLVSDAAAFANKLAASKIQHQGMKFNREMINE